MAPFFHLKASCGPDQPLSLVLNPTSCPCTWYLIQNRINTILCSVAACLQQDLGVSGKGSLPSGSFLYLYSLHWFAPATIAKHHRPGGLNNRNLFSHGSRGWNSDIEVSAGLVSPVATLLGLRMAALCEALVSLSPSKGTSHRIRAHPYDLI